MREARMEYAAGLLALSDPAPEIATLRLKRITARQHLLDLHCRPPPPLRPARHAGSAPPHPGGSICEADQPFLADVKRISIALAAPFEGRRHRNHTALHP